MAGDEAALRGPPYRFPAAAASPPPGLKMLSERTPASKMELSRTSSRWLSTNRNPGSSSTNPMFLPCAAYRCITWILLPSDVFDGKTPSFFLLSLRFGLFPHLPITTNASSLKSSLLVLFCGASSSGHAQLARCNRLSSAAVAVFLRLFPVRRFLFYCCE